MTALLIFAILFLVVFFFQIFVVLMDDYTSIYVAPLLLSINRFFMGFFGLIMAILVVVKVLVEL